jgi:hypothetical protein
MLWEEGSQQQDVLARMEALHALASDGESFAFETTCAGRSHLRLLQQCRDLGYRLTLLFLWLPSAELAVARVAERVEKDSRRAERTLNDYGLALEADVFPELGDLPANDIDADQIVAVLERIEAAVDHHAIAHRIVDGRHRASRLGL